MSRFEKANLILGVVGLLADVAALITFSFNLHVSVSTSSSLFFTDSQLLIISITGVVIAYTWILFSWSLAKYSLLRHTSNGGERKFSSLGYATQAVAAIGVFLAPIIIVWFYTLFQMISKGVSTTPTVFFIPFMGIFFLGAGIIYAISSMVELLLS